jgi:hypothetical protein
MIVICLAPVMSYFEGRYGDCLMQGFYRNHMEEVIKFFETQHKVCRPVYDHSMVTSVNSMVTFCPLL